MDQITLVENQISDGQRLIQQLAAENFDVTAACWAKTSEEERWFLYIASKAVDDLGLFGAYRTVHLVIRAMPDLWVDPFEVKLLGATDPITKDLLKFQSRSPSRAPTRFWGTHLGGVAVEAAYVYPPVSNP